MAAPERFSVVPAVYLVFRNNDEVLLLKRKNTTYFDGHYSLPAGHIDGKEAAINAAIREGKEEVGVTLSREGLRFVHLLHRPALELAGRERFDLFFEVLNFKGEIINAEPDKCSELRWAAEKNLPENIVPEVAQALGCIAAGIYYSDFEF